MTLILTELSPAGIVMAADSSITKLNDRGEITEIDEQGWKKLLRAPSIKAAVSYWGMIGAVTQMQFDQWLERVINNRAYSDLPTFADHIAFHLNQASGSKPLEDGHEVGIHVAGYSEWEDGRTRPMIFHVHNGHGTTEISYECTEFNGKQYLASINPKWVSEPRKLFEKHQDFPVKGKSIEENLRILDGNVTIRNGDYFIYAVIGDALQQAFAYINLIPQVSIPRDPSRLGSRKAMLHMMLDMMVKIYRLSSKPKVIGGEVTSLAIGTNGYQKPVDIQV